MPTRTEKDTSTKSHVHEVETDDLDAPPLPKTVAATPILAATARPGRSANHAAVTHSDLARIVAPIPAFLNAMAEWRGHPDTLHLWRDYCDEGEGLLRAFFQTDVYLLGGADTPLDVGLGTLLRANRKGNGYSPSYPLNITIEAHVNTRPFYCADPINFLLVFSASREASAASCREHAHRLLRYLVDPRNIRPLDIEERKMLGRMPVHNGG